MLCWLWYLCTDKHPLVLPWLNPCLKRSLSAQNSAFFRHLATSRSPVDSSIVVHSNWPPCPPLLARVPGPSHSKPENKTQNNSYPLHPSQLQPRLGRTTTVEMPWRIPGYRAGVRLKTLVRVWGERWPTGQQLLVTVWGNSTQGSTRDDEFSGAITEVQSTKIFTSHFRCFKKRGLAS